MSITETRTVGSIIGGEARSEGNRIESRNPANLDDVICEAALADADTFVDACRAARAAQREWAAVPAPGAGQRGQADRPPRRGQQGGALAARHARDRQALPGGARRGPGDHRHLRLLPLRGSPPVRADRSERDVGQAALHLPQSGRRGRDHHGRQLPRGGAVLVPRSGDPVRQRRRLEARRVRAGARRRARAAVHRGRPAGRRLQPRPERRPHRLRGPHAGARRGARGQGRVHRLVSRWLEDRRAHRPPRAGGLPRAGRQEPARGDAGGRLSTSRSRARSSAASARPGSAVRRSAR